MDGTTPKPFVFVLMPFDPEFDDVYKLGIKPACDKSGAYAERVDEQLFSESILDRIYNQISKADVIVSDMSGRNPNVFYETGYAHALGKTVILITKNSDDIPFDLKHYPHIIYEKKISYLLEELEKWVSWAVHKPTAISQQSLIEPYVDGISIINEPIIEIPAKFFARGNDGAYYKVSFNIDMYNSVKRDFKNINYNFGIVIENNLCEYVTIGTENQNIVNLGDGFTLIIDEHSRTIRPGFWNSVSISMRINEIQLSNGQVLWIRLFTDFNIQDHTCYLEFNKI